MKFRNRYNPNKQKPRREYSVGWLEDRLDILTSLIVRIRNPRCVLCGSVVGLENGHLFTRAWRSTRWDITPDGNCHTLCHAHNMAHEAKPGPFRGYYVKRFGERALDELGRRAASHTKMGYNDLLELWESYKAILAEEKKRVA